MALVRSDTVCNVIGLVGRLPRQMLAEFQRHDKIEYPHNTLIRFNCEVLEWVLWTVSVRMDWFMTGFTGSYDRPDIDQSPRHLSDGLIERAGAALSWGSDSRLRDLVASISRFFKW
jgi:hypothetical protein